MGFRFGCGLLGLASMFALSGSAVAAGKPKILVIPYQALGKGVAPELTEQTTVVVSEEMTQAGLEVIRGDDSLDAPGASSASAASGDDAPTGDARAGEQAKSLIDDADELLDEEDFQGAINKLEKATKLLINNGDAVADLRVIWDAHLKLGVAYFRNGDEDEGDDALTQAIHFAPERTLSDKEWPPVFIRVYDRARYNVLKRPRAQVEVKAKAGASVLFDGRNLGKAPMVLTNVLPGKHWIRVEKPGEPVRVKKVVVRSKRTIMVDFGDGGAAAPSADEGLAGALQKNEIQKAHVDMARDAGKRAGADFVMLGSMYKTQTAYNIYTAFISVKTGQVGRLVDVAFDLDMLTAQIEVYKLAEDAVKQSQGEFTHPEGDLVFALAPKIKVRRKSRAAAAQARVQTVAAAPPPIDKPKAPSYVAGAAAASGVVTPKRATLQIKDEQDETKKSEPKLTAKTVVPKDEDEDGGKKSLWWVWVIAGVAAAGAVTGTAVALGNQSSDEGTLGIRW